MTKKTKQASGGGKPKMTKAERKEKYTRLARERSVQKALRRKGQTLTCFHCRQRGHVAEHCPEAMESSNTNKNRSNNSNKAPKCCYKCGSTEHGLGACPQRNEGPDLPFATCFVCGKQGHLASKCEANEKGIYVRGGSCKVCGSKQHLSKFCPTKHRKADTREVSDVDDDPQNSDLLGGQGDEQRLQNTGNEDEVTDEPAAKPKRRVVKF